MKGPYSHQNPFPSFIVMNVMCPCGGEQWDHIEVALRDGETLDSADLSTLEGMRAHVLPHIPPNRLAAAVLRSSAARAPFFTVGDLF